MCNRCGGRVVECPAIAALVDAQLGLIHREQLEFYGYGRWARSRLIRAKKWRQIVGGVYVVRDVEPGDGWWQRLRAAQLAVPTGIISRRAAAMIYGLDEIRAAPIELSAEKRVRPKKWLVVHKLKDLTPAEVVTIDGMRVTSVVRTIVDLAAVVSEEVLSIVVDSAWRRELTTPEELRGCLATRTRRGVKGARLLRAVLDDCDSRGKPFASYFEIKMWRLILKEGFPRPLLQAHFRDRIGDLYLDFAFFEYGIALETNGAATHTSPADVEKDTRRTARLTAGGWTVLPISFRMLKHNPRRVSQLLRQALALRHELFPPVSLEPDALYFPADGGRPT